jgi:hypothetical protein
VSDFLRLVLCHDCQSVQETPWCGESAQCQHPGCLEPLEARLREHRYADGRPHIGDLGSVPKELWDKKSERPGVLREIEKFSGPPGSGAGMGVSSYDLRSNFEADAMACWKRHNRTKDCADYKTPKMLLLPDTRAERKELGLPVGARPSFHLCSWCPVESIVQTKRNSEKFRYTSPY